MRQIKAVAIFVASDAPREPEDSFWRTPRGVFGAQSEVLHNASDSYVNETHSLHSRKNGTSAHIIIEINSVSIALYERI